MLDNPLHQLISLNQHAQNPKYHPIDLKYLNSVYVMCESSYLDSVISSKRNFVQRGCRKGELIMLNQHAHNIMYHTSCWIAKIH